MHTRGLLTLAASCLALGTVDQATASHNGQVFSELTQVQQFRATVLCIIFWHFGTVSSALLKLGP